MVFDEFQQFLQRIGRKGGQALRSGLEAFTEYAFGNNKVMFVKKDVEIRDPISDRSDNSVLAIHQVFCRDQNLFLTDRNHVAPIVNQHAMLG